MMQSVSVDSASSTPPYEQLQEQLTRLILGGHLTVGRRMPSIRQLSADLGVAPGTVARAYQELERDGLLRSRRPQGTFVAASAHARRQRLLLQGLADRFTEQARQLGVESEEATQALQAAYRRSGPARA